jgi:hypothetical protein
MERERYLGQAEDMDRSLGVGGEGAMRLRGIGYGVGRGDDQRLRGLG